MITPSWQGARFLATRTGGVGGLRSIALTALSQNAVMLQQSSRSTQESQGQARAMPAVPLMVRRFIA